MTLREKRELIEMVLYILHKTGGADLYHVLKILYFAEQKHLLEWGTKMVPDDFHAYEYGPVPDQLYKAVHNNEKYGDELPKLFKETVRFAGNDAPNVLLPLREPDMDWLSKADVKCLDASIEENAGLSFGQLLKKSHDEAWLEAWISAEAGNDDTMNSVSIAKAAGANEGLLEYIEEQMEIDLALR
jgi:uncharacterized phage-associated protein